MATFCSVVDDLRDCFGMLTFSWPCLNHGGETVTFQLRQHRSAPPRAAGQEGSAARRAQYSLEQKYFVPQEPSSKAELSVEMHASLLTQRYG